MNSYFLKLSYTLTGFDELAVNAAETYYSVIKGLFPAIDELLQVYQDKVSDKPGSDELFRINIWQNARYKTICQKIILLWYNTSLNDDLGKTIWQAPPELYYDALLWKAIEAHPPAISGGYFGYWRYEPEN